jgi:hypothetical protein
MERENSPTLKQAKAVTACRSCRRPVEQLVPILSLGNLYVSNFVEASASLDSYPRVPLDLLLCDELVGGCGLVQLKHTTPSAWMYQQYWYRSGTNASMRRALAEITAQGEQAAHLSAGEMVLDIGCNDGTLLRSYRTDGILRAGFEPAAHLLPEASQGTHQIVPAYFNFKDFNRTFPNRRAKIITSIAMFYDLDDPHRFAQDIVQSLDPEGLWIIQMSYLPLMLERNAFDNICHEHLEYYSLGSLKHLLEPHDLRIVDVNLNEVNGGSFRLLVGHRQARLHEDPAAQQRVKVLEDSESRLRLSDRKVYEEFAHRVSGIKDRLHQFISSEVKKGKKVFVYGASTKGNTLLQYCDLSYPLIRAAAERSSQKWGRKTVGTLIPIVSEEEARTACPDFFLVLPWSFLGEFMEREREYLKRGGKFLLPLPSVKVVAL